LVSSGTSASLAAKRHASTLVENLARPGGNMTGFSDILADLGGKQVNLATELQRGQGPIDFSGTLGGQMEKTGSGPIGRLGVSVMGS